jgi:hypothetical protein
MPRAEFFRHCVARFQEYYRELGLDESAGASLGGATGGGADEAPFDPVLETYGPKRMTDVNMVSPLVELDEEA